MYVWHQAIRRLNTKPKIQHPIWKWNWEQMSHCVFLSCWGLHKINHTLTNKAELWYQSLSKWLTYLLSAAWWLIYHFKKHVSHWKFNWKVILQMEFYLTFFSKSTKVFAEKCIVLNIVTDALTYMQHFNVTAGWATFSCICSDASYFMSWYYFNLQKQ